MPTSFIRIIILLGEDFKYGDGGNFQLMLGEMLNHYVCNSVILGSVVS
jgi:hypothetical protein